MTRRRRSQFDATARYTTANLQVYLLRCLAAISKDFAIDSSHLCAGLGFDITDLSNPECRVSFRQAGEVIRRAVKLAPRPDLGLHIGASSTITSLGLVGYAMLTSPTLGDAVAVGISMQNHAGSMLHFDLLHEPEVISIRATGRFHEPDIEAFLVEDAFGTFLRIAQVLVGEAFRPSAVALNYAPPPHFAEYDQTFHCPVLFGAKDNLFSCHAHWAERAIATYDPLTHRQVLEFLQMKATQEHPTLDLIESIERIIRRDFRHAPVLASVAAQLSMSNRTLRRRLAESGLSYQDILDTARKRRALALLANAGLSIDEIAYEVGFSDARNFRRAFKRWTGTAPRAAR
jgi:AraC-like DNA-binding protein